MMLVRCYINLNRFEELYALVPTLLSHRYDDGDNFLKALLSYSYYSPNTERGKEVLLKTIAEVPNEYLAHEKNLATSVVAVFRKFELNERADAIERVAEEKQATK